MPYSCFLFVLNLLYHIEQYYTMVHLCTLYHLWVHLFGCIYLCLPLPGKSTLTFLNISPCFLGVQRLMRRVSCSLIASNLNISQHLAIYVSTITFLNFFSTTIHDVHLLLSDIFVQSVTYYGFWNSVYAFSDLVRLSCYIILFHWGVFPCHRVQFWTGLKIEPVDSNSQ